MADNDVVTINSNPCIGKKLRVLLVWGYHRRGWIAPFEKLSAEFDFRYLFFCTREIEQQEGCFTDKPRYFWDSYPTAQKILDEIRPDRVVFMSLAGVRPISLNMAARRRGITTFIVQHGYFDSLENYLALPTIRSPQAHAAPTTTRGSTLRGLQFLLRSNLVSEPGDTLLASAMLATSRKQGLRRSQLNFRFKGRIPDRYVAYSMVTAQLHRQLDGANAQSIECIGIPEFDQYFGVVLSQNPRPLKQVLLIDSPNAANRYGVTTTTIASKSTFLKRLGEDFHALGYSLKVKLHPESYGASWLPDSGSISYVRDGDCAALIYESKACLGFDSTLMIPAIIARPTMLFDMRPTTLVSNARELGVALVIDGLNYRVADLQTLLELQDRDAKAIEEFTGRFAHVADGKATERLAGALAGAAAQSLHRSP